MQKVVAVVDADEKEAQELTAALEGMDYRAICFPSSKDLEGALENTECPVLIMDLDNSAVDNRFLRHLKKSNPRLAIVALSNRPFHPELKEAMSSHIYACLGRPLDFDELIFWVKSISETTGHSPKERKADSAPHTSENSFS